MPDYVIEIRVHTCSGLISKMLAIKLIIIYYSGTKFNSDN